MREGMEPEIEFMNLSAKEQFNYAQFAQFIDEMSEEFFNKEFFAKERVKNLFFDTYNDNPTKDLHWILDTICETILESMDEEDRKNIFQNLAVLRLKLAGGAKDNFKTKEFLFSGSTQKSGGESKKLKDLKAPTAASGEVHENLIRDRSANFTKYIQTPEDALKKARADRDKKEENKPN